MLRPGGYMTITEADGRLSRECDTFTCAHGNEIVRVPPGHDPIKVGSFCRACMGHLCDKCAAEMDRTLKCLPFERKLEISERRGRFLAALDAADADILLRRSFPVQRRS